jgi:hypothetical protein
MPASFAYLRCVTQHPARGCRRFAAMAFVTLLTLSSSVVAARGPVPAQEVDTAQAAVLRAERVDADQYAAEALLRARLALTQAQALLSAKKAADAIAQAQLAAAEADYAHARSLDARLGTELQQRKAEIAEMRQRLGVEAAP